LEEADKYLEKECTNGCEIKMRLEVQSCLAFLSCCLINQYRLMRLKIDLRYLLTQSQPGLYTGKA